jgi:hypothetical protein
MKDAFKKTALGRWMLEWLIEYKTKARKARVTAAEFQDLRRQAGGDPAQWARYVHDHFQCRTVIDPNLYRLIKKLRNDFQLENFVETGTYEGETALVMSQIFERVFTCDAKDWPRPADFYFADNLVYETKSSPDFLRAHLPKIRTQSLFFLDAHWGPYWPLRDELQIIYSECEKPVVAIDDFDAGHGLAFDSYGAQKLNFEYIAASIPAGYRFCLNPRSNRNCGMIFIFPGSANYGCPFSERDRYNEEQHGLWDKLRPVKG